MAGFQLLEIGEWTGFGRKLLEIPTPQNGFKGLASGRLSVDEIGTEIKSIVCSDPPTLIILMAFRIRGDRSRLASPQHLFAIKAPLFFI